MAFSSKLASLLIDIVVQNNRAINQIHMMERTTSRAVRSFYAIGTAAAAFHVAERAISIVSSILSNLFENARKVEDGFINIEKVLNITKNQTGQFREELLKTVDAMKGISIDEFQRVAAIAGRMGIAKDEIAEFSKIIAITAKALDDLTPETAAEGIGKLLVITGRSTDQAKNLSSLVNTLAQEFLIGSAELLNITLRAQGFAEALGISVEQTAALATALKETGVRTEVAGSTLIVLMQRLSRSPFTVAQAMGLSGEAVQKFADTVRDDAVGAIVQFFDFLKTKNPTQIANLMKELGMSEVRNASAIAGLTRTVDNYRQIQERAWQASREGVSIFQEYQQEVDSLSGSYTELTKKISEFKLVLSKSISFKTGLDDLSVFVEQMNFILERRGMLSLVNFLSAIPLAGAGSTFHKKDLMDYAIQFATSKLADAKIKEAFKKNIETIKAEDKAAIEGGKGVASRFRFITGKGKENLLESDPKYKKYLEDQREAQFKGFLNRSKAENQISSAIRDFVKAIRKEKEEKGQFVGLEDIWKRANENAVNLQKKSLKAAEDTLQQIIDIATAGIPFFQGKIPIKVPVG